ncbi:hypothetical protein TMatcc_007450 [Talaromyces marneffei ATCC 18224]
MVASRTAAVALLLPLGRMSEYALPIGHMPHTRRNDHQEENVIFILTSRRSSMALHAWIEMLLAGHRLSASTDPLDTLLNFLLGG